MLRRCLPIAPSALLVLMAACSGPTPSGSGTISASAVPTPFAAAFHDDLPYAPAIDPSRFVATVDNRWFPLVPGTRWELRGRGDEKGETTVTRVTRRTRMVLGVECTVVRDEVRVDGAMQELTFDWYAQDVDGNVWYFGEDTAEYENGKVANRHGAWEAGVDGAYPGIIMPAQPVVGLTYRQEFYAGEAEDLAKVLDLAATADTPVASYADVLVTEDWSPLEPDIVERKYYAPGVGLVMERATRGGSGGIELVDLQAGD